MGAVGALVMAISRNRLTLALTKQALNSTAKLSAFVVFILIGSTTFNLAFQAVDGNKWVEHLLDGLPGGQIGFLIVVNILVFVLAFFLDFFELAFIIVPLLGPVAEKLGIDRAEIRRRNLVPADRIPYKTPLKTRGGMQVVLDSGDYPRCQAAALEMAQWSDFRARQEAARAKGRYIGMGLANYVEGTGRGPFEPVSVRVAENGRIHVASGAAAMAATQSSTARRSARKRNSIVPMGTPMRMTIEQATSISKPVSRMRIGTPSSTMMRSSDISTAEGKGTI